MLGARCRVNDSEMPAWLAFLVAGGTRRTTTRWLSASQEATVVGLLERGEDGLVLVPDPVLGLLLATAAPAEARAKELGKALAGAAAVLVLGVVIYLLSDRLRNPPKAPSKPPSPVRRR